MILYLCSVEYLCFSMRAENNMYYGFFLTSSIFIGKIFICTVQDRSINVIRILVKKI